MEQEMQVSKEIEVEQAIRISKILCQAPEERLPLILSTPQQAGIIISGMEELAEWKALKDQAYLIDTAEFVASIIKDFGETDGDAVVPAKTFSNYCKERNLKPILVKGILARHGYLTPTIIEDKKEYTKTIWNEGANARYVVIHKEPRRV